MNNFDLNLFSIMLVGQGKEYFDDLANSEINMFREKGFNFNISEGFSRQKVTRVMVLIGSNVITAMSVYDLVKIFDKIFIAKSKAKEHGLDLQIHVSISENVIMQDVKSTVEIEQSINLVNAK